MREIKFSYIFQHEETGNIIDKRFTLEQIEEIDFGHYITFDLHRFALVSKRQYTGLKDKNGKEIYEGDIVNLIEQNGAKDIVSFEGQDCFVVNFDRGCFVLSEIKELLMNIGSYLLCDIEVVGNIYENPELLNK